LSPQSIVQWFAPPELARPDLRQRARSLWILSWPFFAIIAVLLGIAVLAEPGTAARRATTIVAVGGLIGVLHSISRAGRPVFASWVLVIGLPVIVTQRAWATGGIHAPVSVFYALFIVMAGVLLGMSGGLATAAVCTLGAIALTVGTAFDWLPAHAGAGSAVSAYVFVMLSIGLALLLQAALTARPRRDVLDTDGVHLVVDEMRSSMQVLLTRLEVLRRHLTGDYVEDVEAAIGGVRSLRRTTNCMLDVSRLESGQMPIQRSVTDLWALVHGAVATLGVVQPAREIAVEMHGPSMCICDTELTRRVVENLVSNAVKVTPAGGRVRVVVSASRERVSIWVADEGPPILTEQMSVRFCRLAVEAQGGTMRIERGTPRGNVSVVELSRAGV
jgi:signal transduction histidine kinase